MNASSPSIYSGLPADFAFAGDLRKNAAAGKAIARMWYFAFGSNLNARAVAEWCRHFGYRCPGIKGGKPAVLDNYRMGFPIYNEYWGGGTADIVYDPGKYVMGVLFDLSETDMGILDQKVGRKLDSAGRELGVYKRIDVKISPLGKGTPVNAVTYQGVNIDRSHVPPTQHYMDLLIQGAFAHGISTMWISYLQSFSTQKGRMPRPPGVGDAAPKL